MKGIVNYYINSKDEEQFNRYVELFKKNSGSMLEQIRKTGYEIAFVPVENESSRVTRMDLFSTPTVTQEEDEDFEHFENQEQGI